MPISPLLHNDTNFEDIKDRGQTMNAVTFDVEFSKIVNFINNKIISVLNQLISDSVPGSVNPNDINKFRRNIGDGTTDWASIGNDALIDFSLEFSKLSKCTPCSILATGADKIFKEVTTDQSNFTLISQANNLPVWRKISSENIFDRNVTADHIALGTLTNDNFENGLLVTQLLDDAVTAIKIVDRTISTVKIEEGAIDGDVLRDLQEGLIGRRYVDNTLRNIQLWGNTLPDGFIPAPGYFFFTQTIDYTHLRNDFKLPIGKLVTSIQGKNIADGAIANYQIANQSLNGERLNQAITDHSYRLPRDINDLIADGGIAPENLPLQYRQALGL